MKTAVIMCAGSYYSPWMPYCIASTYAIGDFMIIVNAGFDLKNPSLEENDVPVKKVSRDINNLDVDDKIIEVFTVSEIKRKVPLLSQKKANELKLEKWYDLRGRNMTLASEKAYEEGAEMVFRLDTDQVCYKNALKIRGMKTPLILYQYEFQGDVYHLADPGPNDPFNDSIYYYPISKDDWYIGGLAPVIHSDRKNCPKMHCAHLRYANPLELSVEEKFQHFRDRFLYHLWTNEYGEFNKELIMRAEKMAKDHLEKKGKPSNIPPPEVCLMDPKKYIEETKIWEIKNQG